MSYEQVLSALQKGADPRRAVQSQRYFKTGPGQYGAGDVFWGLTVPQLHRLSREHVGVDLPAVARLLNSEIHEQRLLGLLILRQQYATGDEREQGAIYAFYVKNLVRVNNWDLVDGSAPYIVGVHLATRNRAPLFTWVRSANLWERRVAIVATWWFIRQNDFADALRIAEQLLQDPEDLIHKAVGWMLREIDKRDHAVAVRFLQANYPALPRTTLRYAIERFAPAARKAALLGHFEGARSASNLTAAALKRRRKD